MRKIVALMVVFISVAAAGKAQAQNKTYVLYTEARYAHNGDGNVSTTSANGTDVAAGLALYSAGLDVFAEGRLQFLKKLPLSIGLKFLWQDPKWTERDEFLLGPTLQYLWRHLALRFELLFDLQELDVGVVHPYFLYFREWGKKHILQLSLQGHYFWFGPDRYELASGGYYDASEHQVFGELEMAYHPGKWKWIYPLIFVNGSGHWSKSVTHTSDGEFPASESRGQVTAGGGLKGEIPAGDHVVFWWYFSAGYQELFGKHHQPSKRGVVARGSLGIYFK